MRRRGYEKGVKKEKKMMKEKNRLRSGRRRRVKKKRNNVGRKNRRIKEAGGGRAADERKRGGGRKEEAHRRRRREKRKKRMMMPVKSIFHVTLCKHTFYIKSKHFTDDFSKPLQKISFLPRGYFQTKLLQKLFPQRNNFRKLLLFFFFSKGYQLQKSFSQAFNSRFLFILENFLSHTFTSKI